MTSERTAADLAAEALALVGVDPRRALAAADRAVAAARVRADRTAEGTADRAAGLALRELGDLAAAETRARRAVRSGRKSGTAQNEAEARMSLAFVLLERGRVTSALAQSELARSGLAGGNELAAARLEGQRALILQRAGRFDEALAAYASALPVLRRARDDRWEARLLSNRGLLHAYRGALVAAESDLGRALELELTAGQQADAADTEWNLGFVAARRGDLPAALARYDHAEAMHSRLGTPNPQLLLDRCEVLLAAGLPAEARRSAERAIGDLGATGQEADRAEGLLILAQAALADGAPTAACDAAREAERAFARQHRAGWRLQARYLRLQAEERSEGDRRRLLTAALATATALADAGWRAAELDARVAAARAALALGRLDVAGEQLARAGAARRSGSTRVRARAWYAEALLREATGDRRGTMSALRAGLRSVERQQALVGATELRVNVAAHGADLARLGVGLAAAEGSARDVLVWAERWRAGALRLRPVRPPADPALAAALAELRRLSAEAAELRLEGESVRAPAARRRVLEEQVVRAVRGVGGGLHAAAGLPSVEAIGSSLDGRALVEYVEVDGGLVAVTLSARRCRLHRLGPLAAAASELAGLHFALTRMASGIGSTRGLSAARRAADETVGRLDELLLAPLRDELGGSPLIVVPTGELHSLPWSLLPTLSQRPVTVAPSASAWHRAALTPTRTDAPIVLAAGPGLPAARSEVLTLSSVYPGATVLLDDAATAAAVLTALDGAGLAHVAAHGHLRADNPLFSALRLADGPLTVYDLEGLSSAPQTVVLPACRSAVTARRAGDEMMGLASALFALGTRTLVATLVPVPDEETGALSVALHRELARGADPAAALVSARSALDLAHTNGYATAAAFVVLGA